MSYDGKRWRLTNMSTTNPVVVNGAPLDGEGTSQVLSEGDRVEMGEVAFRFRGR
jgi:predicted component of type VI protein secretion system